MHPTFKKLNFAGQPQMVVLGAPQSFQGVLDEMQPLTTVLTNWPDLAKADATAPSPLFALAFCTRQAELDALSAQVQAQTTGDATIWVAYPKQTSRRYQCEFNRDTGWHAFGQAGFEPVRQVAIDEDWSALRLRRTEFIKSLTRRKAISEAGQQRLKPEV